MPCGAALFYAQTSAGDTPTTSHPPARNTHPVQQKAQLALLRPDAIGLLSPSARSDAGYRLYNEADLTRLHRILALRRFGMALAEIGTTLTGPGLPFAELVERQIAMLDRQIEQASILRSRLLFAKLNAMQEQEPSVQERTGITPALMAFVLAASKENQLAVYEKYLDADELAFMRANLGKRNAEWPPLIARVRTAMDEGRAPDSAEAQALAHEWFDLFRSFVGAIPQPSRRSARRWRRRRD